jgi:hypothetical protein
MIQHPLRLNNFPFLELLSEIASISNQDIVVLDHPVSGVTLHLELKQSLWGIFTLTIFIVRV